MKNISRVYRLFTSYLSLISILFNIFQPALFALTIVPLASAEEEIVASEPSSSSSPTESISSTDDPNITPSAEPTSNPVESPTPSPEYIATPSPSIEPSIDPSPSIEPVPSTIPPSPTPNESSSPAPPAETQQSSEAKIPIDSTTPAPSPSTSTLSTSTPTLTYNLNETLQINIFENTEAESLSDFDLTVTEEGSATLITDKADYAPTDTALISGAGFLSNTTYSLIISSTDDPATSTTVAVTTDDDGKLFYAYQLDGIYRPNYKVEAYLGSTLVASTTFTDSYIVGSYLCDNDAQGADDEPGQKDLTKMCVNDTALPVSIQANWNWDDTGWSGNNTGDSCALFDTDNDGLANFASCVTVENKPATQKSTSPRIFTCNDSRADRCAGPTLVVGPYNSSCSVSISSDQPFITGDDTPKDTQASCNIKMSEVGGSGIADLIDVCSFPSDNPNSDPSDCIFAKANSGKLEVIKVISPTNDNGLFNLQIDSITKAVNVGNNGSTGENIVSAGNHVVSETAGTATTLTNYSASVVCRDLNGTGAIIAANANSGTVTVNIADASDVVCTITNTRINNASLTIIKDAVPNDPQDFSFTTTGTGLSSFSLDDDSDVTLSNTKVFSNLAAGTYSVSETPVTGWDLTSATCTDGSTVNSINLTAGENVTCTFTNTKKGNLIVQKTTQPSGDLTSFTISATGSGIITGSATNVVTDANDYTYEVTPGTYIITETVPAGWAKTVDTCQNVVVAAGETKSCQLTNVKNGTIIVEKDMVGGTDSFGFTGSLAGTISSDNGQITLSVAPGTYTSVEESKSGWQLDSIVCNDTTNGGIASTGNINTRTATFSVEAGETVKCTFTNTKLGTITVEKQTLPDSDPASFSFTPSYGSDFSLSDGQTNTSNYLYPGTYSVTENPQSGWTLTSKSCSDQSDPVSISLSAGENVSCVFTNTKHGSIAGIKYNDLNGDGDWDPGEPVASGWLISLLDDEDNVIATDTTDANGEYSFADLLPGLYSLTETLQDGWVQTGSPSDINLAAGQNSTNNNFFNFQKIYVSGQKFNDRNGNGVKEVGEEGIPNWTIYLSSGNTTTSTTTDINGNYQFNGLVPGSYTVFEDTSVAGWTQTYPAGSTYTFEAVSGQSKTGYDFGNHAKGKITLVKSVTNNNGGVAGVNDFGLSVGGVNVNSGGTLTLPAYNSYTLNEVGLPGYNFVSITGHAKCPSVLGGSVALAPNDDVTCTITNDDQPGTLTVTKVTVPTDSATAFSITATGSGTIQGDATRSLKDGAPVIYTLDAGSYTVTETVPAGWDQTGNTCVDIQIRNGGSNNCTITNTKRGHLIVQKTTIPAADQEIFALTATGSGTITGGGAGSVSDSTDHNYEVYPGTYSVAETVPGNWDQTSNTCTDIVVGAGEAKYCEIINTKRGNVTVIKYHDHNGNGTQDIGDETLNDWEINLDKMSQWTGAQVAGQVTFSDLLPGSYILSESIKSGWIQTNISCSTDSELGLDDDNSHSVTVNAGETTTCKVGNFKLGRIYGYKYEDANGNGLWDEGENPLANWTIYLGDTSTSTNHDGYFEFDELLSGNYTLTEDESNTNYVRTEPISGSYSVAIISGTGYNKEAYYLFGNAPLTDIHGYKWNDINGNGNRDCDILSELSLLKRFEGCDYTEELLGGWTIFVDENDNQILDEGEQSTTTDNDPESEHYGWYWFEDLFPGTYTICEVQQDGWQQTYPSFDSEVVCHTITVPNDNNQTENGVVGPEYHFGNQAEPELLIQKINDAPGNKNPGELVTYTLKLNLSGSNLSNVSVTDVTPDGFIYVPGSYAVIKNGLPISVAEPTYASPGVWALGDLQTGDEVILTYQVKINSDQDGGTYNDIAWAVGNSPGWGEVLATGHDSEYVDDIFVGTDVVIVKNIQATGSVDIEKEGEVLGAATSLPATGASTLWLILGISSIITGLLFLIGNKKMRRIILLPILALVLLLPVAKVEAADLSNNLSVRVEQPQNPTRLQEWKLSYSVLDRAMRTPTISCFIKKPGDPNFVQFDITKVASKPTGDNGYCQLTSSQISSQGVYELYVAVNAGSDSEASATVSVTYDTDGPGTPSSYSKEHPSLCRWVIKFKTAADDGLTKRVEIYSSDQTSFNTDNGTRVGSVEIGSNAEGSFTHDRADNCDKTYYYVIRAYDNIGNFSAHRGDEVVITNTIATSTAPVSAIARGIAGGTVLGANQVESDEVDTNESSISGEVMGENAQVVDTQDSPLQSVLNSSRKWWFIALGSLLAILVLLYLKRHRHV